MESKCMIPVRCIEEGCLVGNLEVSLGEEILLTPDRVWASFVPISEERKLWRQMQKTGDTLKCPKCKSMLSISTESKIGEDKRAELEKQRAVLRAKAIKELNSTDYLTVGGRTHKVVARKHVGSVDWPDGESPIVLGQTKIKAEE